MDVYSTEEEQIESIKKWWKENGRAVIAGAVLGIGGIFAWQGWTAHKVVEGAEASMRFEYLLESVRTGRGDVAGKQADALIADYESTPYALFGALSDARAKLEQNDIAAARARLEWVIANAGDGALREIARLRLARILLSEGDLKGAEKLAAARTLTSYAGEYAELEGDIAAAREDRDAAARAYRSALEQDVSNAATVRMKLDDLAVDADLPSSG